MTTPENYVERNKIYRINEGVLLVEGVQRAAIYDTIKGNVYSLNQKARDIVLEQRNDTGFCEELRNLGLLFKDNNIAEFEVETPNFGLEFVWLELTSKCNLTCLHCYAESSPKIDQEELPTKIWEKVIEEGAKIGCRQLQFIGGEPLIFEQIFDLAACAKSFGYQFIEIFTNGTLLNADKVKRIKDLGLRVAVSLYSNDPVIHDLVTGSSGSFNKTMSALRLLKEAEVPIRIGVVIMNQNQATVGNTLEMIQKMGFDGGESADVVRTIGRGKKQNLLPDPEVCRNFGTMIQPVFVTDKNSFERNCIGNPCWLGKIAVTATGDIIPCVAGRQHIVGNVAEELEEAVEGNPLQKLWRISKDKIKVCSGCEYRYACGDCRPLAEAETGNLYSKTPRCDYDPFTGEWKKGGE